MRSFVVAFIVTCRAVPAGGELTWNYGPGYEPIRRRARYVAGRACSDESIGSLRLPSPRSRVEAILQRGGDRMDEVLFELPNSSSDESSGDEWRPSRGTRAA